MVPCVQYFLYAPLFSTQVMTALILFVDYSPQIHLISLQEQCQSVSDRNSHVVLQLEHAQSLLSQFSESHAEVSPWLLETQALISQLSLNTVSYEAFKGQQDLLQVCLAASPPTMYISYYIIAVLLLGKLPSFAVAMSCPQ